MRKDLSWEGLRLIACGAMLADHIGAIFWPEVLWLRCVGRLAFPIFCFQLCEGVKHTGSLGRYGSRLGFGALLSEIPFDLLFYGTLTLGRCSVMVTLLLGFLVLLCMDRSSKPVPQLLVAVVAVVAAEWLGTDYGGWGIVMILIFACPMTVPLRLGAMAVLCWTMGGAQLDVLGLRIPAQMFALLALVPIGLYSGKKRRSSRVAQWGWYLFYPVHLVVLLVIQGVC